MDSRQLYRGMDIGTAKASAKQRAAVPHHGLDLVDPGERFSAGRFARYARARIAEILARGRVPLLVGGTGFFLRALTNPIFRQPELEPERRARLQELLEHLTTPGLERWLAALDPSAAQRLQQGGGRQRLIRALEMPLLTGRSLSWWHANSPPEAEPLLPLVCVLEVPPAQLAAAIDERAAGMLGAGLVQEVQGLLASGIAPGEPGMNATGYIELVSYLAGERTLGEALDRIRANTRAYARRQRTWFRTQLPAGAIRLDATRPRAELAEEIVRRAQSTDYRLPTTDY